MELSIWLRSRRSTEVWWSQPADVSATPASTPAWLSGCLRTALSSSLGLAQGRVHGCWSSKDGRFQATPSDGWFISGKMPLQMDDGCGYCLKKNRKAIPWLICTGKAAGSVRTPYGSTVEQMLLRQNHLRGWMIYGLKTTHVGRFPEMLVLQNGYFMLVYNLHWKSCQNGRFRGVTPMT